jgi:hypothetical protein
VTIEGEIAPPSAPQLEVPRRRWRQLVAQEELGGPPRTPLVPERSVSIGHLAKKKKEKKKEKKKKSNKKTAMNQQHHNTVNGHQQNSPHSE